MKKNIILSIILILTPLFLIGQTEIQEKQQKRAERYLNTPPETVLVPTPNYNPYLNPYHPNVYYNSYTPYNPYYGIPTVTSRMFGRTVVSMGIISTIGIDPILPTFGMYGTIGSENTFFKLSYEGSKISTVEHFPNIPLNKVYEWEDEPKGEFERYSSLFLGVGGMATRTIYPFLGINIYTIDKNLFFFDPDLTITNDGLYSIDGLNRNGLNVRGGIMFRKNNFEMETNLTLMNPARLGFGIGFNF